MSCSVNPMLGTAPRFPRPLTALGMHACTNASPFSCRFRGGGQSDLVSACSAVHRPIAGHARRPCCGSRARPAAAAAASRRCQPHVSRLQQRCSWSGAALGPAVPAVQRARRRPRYVQTRAVIETDSLVPLGLDFLTFLAATVLVIPLFKSIKASPILGFLFSGVVLGQLGCAAGRAMRTRASLL